MNQSTYSPSPWQIKKTKTGNRHFPVNYTICEKEKEAGTIALVYGYTGKTCQANLRLIVAAPDLLAALHFIAEQGNDHRTLQAYIDELKSVARDAIAQAETPA